MAVPDFVVAGHVVRDLVPGGWRLGGTAAFAAVQAQRLGLRAGIVTRASAEMELDRLLPGIDIAGRPSDRSTSFENIYQDGRRRQRVPEQAGPVGAEDVPVEWRRAPIALVGPVCGEIGVELAGAFGGLTGVSAQGWLRDLDTERTVRPRRWEGPPFWAGARVLFVSDEDLGGERPPEGWLAEVPIVVMTKERRGAEVWEEGRRRAIEAFPASDVDPTGAGDIFAAAFLIRYHEASDAVEASRFASAAAACSVEGVGIEYVAGREAIAARMERHPEITLR